jgi:hypothetical protein
MSQPRPGETSVLRLIDEAMSTFHARCGHGVALVTSASNEIILFYRGQKLAKESLLVWFSDPVSNRQRRNR